MWLALWAVFAVAVLGFVGWSIVVLMQQKSAWSGFAKKNNLRYQAGKFMDSPTVSGDLGPYKFSLYSGVQQTDDIRGQRFVTVIEFQIGRGMPTGAVIATKEFGAFIDGLIFDRKYTPKIPEWRKDFIVRARSRKNLRAWFTTERQQVLAKLFSMKNISALFFFDELEAVLRIETPNPLRDTAHLDKIVQRLRTDIDRLAPTAEEKKEFRLLLVEEKKLREQGLDPDDHEEYDEDEAADREPVPAQPVEPQANAEPPAAAEEQPVKKGDTPDDQTGA